MNTNMIPFTCICFYHTKIWVHTYQIFEYFKKNMNPQFSYEITGWFMPVHIIKPQSEKQS